MGASPLHFFLPIPSTSPDDFYDPNSLRTDQGPATPDLIANTAFRYLQTTSQWLEAREKALVARPQVLRTLVARARRATARKQVFSFLVAASSVSSRTTPRTRCASAPKPQSTSPPSSSILPPKSWNW